MATAAKPEIMHVYNMRCGVESTAGWQQIELRGNVPLNSHDLGAVVLDPTGYCMIISAILLLGQNCTVGYIRTELGSRAAGMKLKKVNRVKYDDMCNM